MHPAALGATLAAIVAVLVLLAAAAPVGYVPDVPAPGVAIPHGPAGPPSTGESLSPVTVWQSTYIDFGVEERSYRVVQSDEEWQALWGAIRGNPAPPPDVDFATQTVIAAFFGIANTGGYSIKIGDILLGQDAAPRVLTETRSPGPGCGTTEALTYPVHMVSIPKSDGPFVVEETAIVYSCGSG